jgi:hypothetical protein
MVEGILECVIQHCGANVGKGCAVVRFHRVCSFLYIRPATISLTPLSTIAVKDRFIPQPPGSIMHQHNLFRSQRYVTFSFLYRSGFVMTF